MSILRLYRHFENQTWCCKDSIVYRTVKWESEREIRESPLGENTWPAEARARGDERVWEQLFDTPLQSRNRRESLPEDCSHLLYLAQQASGVFCTTQLFSFFSVERGLPLPLLFLSLFPPQQGKSPFFLLFKWMLKIVQAFEVRETVKLLSFFKISKNAFILGVLSSCQKNYSLHILGIQTIIGQWYTCAQWWAKEQHLDFVDLFVMFI